MNFDYFVASEAVSDELANQDAYVTDLSVGLFAVADGMGGHAGGATASRVAVEELLGELAAMPPAQRLQQDRLCEVLVQVNRAVRTTGEVDCDLAGLGTTLSAVVVSDGAAAICHVGDSRIYRARATCFEQLTKDHTAAAELVSQSKLTTEDARYHFLRHRLTRAIGVEETIQADIHELRLEGDDWIVIATDGLEKRLELEELQAIVIGSHQQNAAELGDQILCAARRKRRVDDMTFVVVRCLEEV